MKLLDPLGGLLVTTGSPPMHILYFVTYIVLLFFKFDTEELWLKEYFYWWLGTYSIIVGQFVVMYFFWNRDQTTYM